MPFSEHEVRVLTKRFDLPNSASIDTYLSHESSMPILFNPNGIVGLNFVDQRRFLGKLDRQFVFSYSDRLASTNLVVPSRFKQVNIPICLLPGGSPRGFQLLFQ